MKTINVTTVDWNYIQENGCIYVENECNSYEIGEHIEIRTWRSNWDVDSIELVVHERCNLLNGRTFYIFKLVKISEHE